MSYKTLKNSYHGSVEQELNTSQELYTIHWKNINSNKNINSTYNQSTESYQKKSNLSKENYAVVCGWPGPFDLLPIGELFIIIGLTIDPFVQKHRKHDLQCLQKMLVFKVLDLVLSLAFDCIFNAIMPSSTPAGKEAKDEFLKKVSKEIAETFGEEIAEEVAEEVAEKLAKILFKVTFADIAKDLVQKAAYKFVTMLGKRLLKQYIEKLIGVLIGVIDTTFDGIQTALDLAGVSIELPPKDDLKTEINNFSDVLDMFDAYFRESFGDTLPVCNDGKNYLIGEQICLNRPESRTLFGCAQMDFDAGLCSNPCNNSTHGGLVKIIENLEAAKRASVREMHAAATETEEGKQAVRNVEEGAGPVGSAYDATIGEAAQTDEVRAEAYDEYERRKKREAEFKQKLDKNYEGVEEQKTQANKEYEEQRKKLGEDMQEAIYDWKCALQCKTDIWYNRKKLDKSKLNCEPDKKCETKKGFLGIETTTCSDVPGSVCKKYKNHVNKFKERIDAQENECKSQTYRMSELSTHSQPAYNYTSCAHRDAWENICKKSVAEGGYGSAGGCNAYVDKELACRASVNPFWNLNYTSCEEKKQTEDKLKEMNPTLCNGVQDNDPCTQENQLCRQTSDGSIDKICLGGQWKSATDTDILEKMDKQMYPWVFGSQEYVVMNRSTDSCPSGYQEISETDCEASQKKLGNLSIQFSRLNKDTTPGYIKDPVINEGVLAAPPKGCNLLHRGTTWATVIYNSNSDGASTVNDYYRICKKDENVTDWTNIKQTFYNSGDRSNNCKMSDWGEWTSCSKECNGGTQNRIRSIKKGPKDDGLACGPKSETRTCNTERCPANVKTGKTVCIKASNNQHFATEGDNRKVNANRGGCGGWEKYEFVNAGGGFYAIKNLHWNKYLSCQPDGRLTGDKNHIGGWEKFKIYDTGGGTVAIRCAAHGQKYLVAEGGGGGEVKADRNGVGGWEKFKLDYPSNIQTGKTVCIKAANNQHFATEGDNRKVNANRGGCGGWEKYEFVDAGGGLYGIKNKRWNRYLSCQANGKLEGNRSGLGGWEKFKIHEHSDGRVSFQCWNRKYLVAESGGGREVKANRNGVGGWEKFKIYYP